MQGDIIGIYDSTGTVVVRYTYDAWGKLISITGQLANTVGVKNPLRYRGYYYDTEIGLYYLQSRYYDPETCHFINRDSYFIAGNEQKNCSCTPYKQNANGSKTCKVYLTSTPSEDGDVGNINSYSYLRHEFEQAKKRNKTIIVVYNSLTKQANWLPSYMKDYESEAQPFWTKNSYGNEVGNYSYIKEALGYV